MSKKLNRSQRLQNRQGQAGNELIQGSDIFNAFKTYLQEQIAIQRPQVSHNEMAQLYRFSVTAHALVDCRAEALRQVDFAIGDAQGNILEDLPPEGKYIQSALRSGFPNLIERSEVSYCYYGESLWMRLYSGRNHLSGFQWINNNFYMTDTSTWYGLKGFRIRASWGGDIEPDITYLKPEDTVFMHTIDFFDDFGGLGPVQVAYLQAATEAEIANTQLNFFRNMAMPAFAMQPAQGVGYVPGPDQKEEITELLRRMYQGSANAGRGLILPTRWETVKFQTEFDKLDMSKLSDNSRDALVRILRVPLELVEPHQSTRQAGTKFYDQRREWLISWLVPQAERYADVLSDQIVKPINPDWRIVPIFTRVRGLDEDISSRTDTINKQVSMAVLDLYRAQQILGVDPDENLRNIYLIGGIPVPSSAFESYHLYAPGNPGIVQGGELSKVDKPDKKKDSPKAPEALPSPKTPNSSAGGGKTIDVEAKTISFLPDNQYSEWRNWKLLVERKGKSYAFVGKALAADTVALGRFLIATGSDTAQEFESIRIAATKDYSDTERAYRAGLFNVLNDGFSGSLDRKQFGIVGRDEISTAFLNAFINGLQEGGVTLRNPSELDEDEKRDLDLEIKTERSYFTALANEVFREVLPLQGTPEFEPARDAILGRIETWIAKGLNRIKNQGVLSAKASQMLRWVLGPTETHCPSCSTASGQIHRAREWSRAGLAPGVSELDCEGFKCLCEFEPVTNEGSSGSLAAIPRFGGKSHDHEGHIHSDDDPEPLETAV